MLKMKTSGFLWDLSITPPKATNFVGDEIPLEEVSRSADGVWVQVKAHFPLSVEPVSRWVVAADVVEDDSGPAPLNIWAFLKYCNLASNTANLTAGATQIGVNRDYLVALAQ